MLYAVLVYLIIFTILSFRVFNDIMSPTVIIGLTMIFGTVIACIGNINCCIEIQVDILIVYLLGTFFLFIGEAVATNNKKKIVIKCGATYITSQNRFLKPNNIPFKYTLVLFIFTLVVAVLCERRYINIAYTFGYTGESWQSLQKYIKEALMYRNARLGMGLATAYSIVTVLAYIFLEFFTINCCYNGIKNTIKKHWFYLLPVFSYVYVNNVQGQRSGYIGLISFVIFSYFIANSAINNKKINVMKFVKYGLIAVLLFIIVFVISAVENGRLQESNAIESVKIYAGSAIVDLANYFNNGAEHTEKIGQSTFPGLRSTISRFIPINNNMKSVFGFVRFANGSYSNVYTAFGHYYADFGYIGIVFFSFLSGYLYKRLYNNTKGENISYGALYIYSYLTYGLVMTFIAEQQFTMFMSVNQLMHFFFAYFLLNIFVKKFVVLQSQTKGEVYENIGRNSIIQP